MSFHSDVTESGPAHEQVVRAVANADGVGPTDLQPLYETVDPEALDALFEPGVDGTVAFTYEGHDVVIDSADGVTVDGTPVDDRSTRTVGVGDGSGASAAGQ